MHVLDTNVLSDVMSRRPTPAVAAWIADQPVGSLFTTSVCRAEILAGIALLPQGRRRNGLEAAARAIFTEVFDGRVLPFESEAAIAYAAIYTARRRAGRPIATTDLIIAAIARTSGATIVTRDAGGFAGCGVAVVDPWESI